MGGFIKGDVVVVLFPFSDLSSAKKRPALVIAVPGGDDVILCQITSRQISDQYAIPLQDEHFSRGSLGRKAISGRTGCSRQTAGLSSTRAGHLNDNHLEQVIHTITGILTS